MDRSMSEYSEHPFDLTSSNNSWSHLYSYIEDKSKVLDVGCSTGAFGAALRDLKQCIVVGIDINREDLKKAKENLDKAVYMDANDPALLKLGKFDVVIFADVLEHLIDPRATLQNIKQILKPNGIVIFSLPNMAHMSVRLDLLTGTFPYKNVGLLDKTHLHFYDKRETESMFREAGYKIEQMNPVLSEYPGDIIQEKLKETGLKYTNEFADYLRESSGNIFQFVGYAKPSKKEKHQETKYIMPQDEITNYADTILVENRRLWESEERLKKEITLLQEKLNEDEVKNSKVGRFVTQKISKIRHTEVADDK